MPDHDLCTEDFDAELAAQLEAKLGEIFAEQGAMVTGFSGLVEFVDVDGNIGYARFAPADQLHKDTIAQLDFALAYQLEVRRLNIHDDLRSRSDPD